MTGTAADAYGRMAGLDLSPTRQAGRYDVQAESERRILPDVIAKLDIRADVSLLDIGCGPGNLLVPLSFLVARATGIDHPAILSRYASRLEAKAISLVAGTFPSTRPDGTFDRILCYSVLSCLPDMVAATAFVADAARLLNHGGRLLIGDLPSRGKKKRFLESDAGRAFDREWRTAAADRQPSPADVAADQMMQDVAMKGDFTDAELAFLVGHMREAGFHAYLLPQPPDLPFGHTREDILLIRP